MSRLRLLWRTAWHFRMANLAVLLGIAVGTAVFAGSLIVGDSVRDSLRRIADNRLGTVDHVMVCPRLFQQSLADRLSVLPAFREGFLKAEAGLSLRGNCVEPESGRTAPRVEVFGRADVAPGGCVISRPLADALRAAPGGAIVVRTRPAGKPSIELPFDQRGDEVASLRLTIQRVAEETEMEGSFTFYGSQRPVRNVWVPLGELQKSLSAAGGANVLFVTAQENRKGKEGAEQLQGMLKSAVSLEDYGLRLVGAEAGQSLESQGIFLGPAVEEATRRFGGERVEVLAYLANSIADVRAGHECPYSMVAGVTALPDGPIGPEEIVLNRWAADDLGAKPGDEIRLAYFVRGAGGLLVEKQAGFKLGRVIETRGIGADRTLVPPFQGVTDAEKMGDWNPPPDFDFHPNRIRPIDEEYWTRFRSAPKAFVEIGAARRLWGTRFGGLTAVRFRNATRDDLAKRLLAEISPASMGLVIRPIRFEQLRSASGNTDFSALFVGFSFFLIVSAAMLVALLLRLSIDQRSRQIGILMAEGFTERTIRWLLLGEGMLILPLGGAAGVALSVGYADTMMLGLRTVWREAVGTTLLSLSLRMGTLAVGLFAGVLIGAVAIWRGVARLRDCRIAEMLGGGRIGDQGGSYSGKAAPLLATALFIAGMVLICLSGLTDRVNAAGAFFGAGACLLLSYLLLFRTALIWLRQSRRRTVRMTVLGFGVRNAARNRGRSMLTVGILASAYFVLFAVGAMRTKESSLTSDRHGSTGGYGLIAEFDIPLPYDIGSERGRRCLGMNSAGDAAWKGARVVRMRASSGEDVSCRNLYRPSTPRILSVPDEMIAEAPFAFASSITPAENPWELLRSGHGADKPVAVGADTAQWILQKSLGDTIPIVDELGVDRSLRIVALLKQSPFQGEILMGEKDFLTLFPSRSGDQTLLIQSPPEAAAALRAILCNELGDFGVTVETTRERLASFYRIANAYISAFEMIGGLGILLGSLGLVVVLMRGVIERRGEFALMSAVGFPRGLVIRLILAENGFLLVAGILVGVASAVVAIFPQLWRNGLRFSLHPMGSVALTLAVSLGVFVMAAGWSLRGVSPATLRRE